jgi:hypothetical protein
VMQCARAAATARAQPACQLHGPAAAPSAPHQPIGASEPSGTCSAVPPPYCCYCRELEGSSGAARQGPRRRHIHQAGSQPINGSPALTQHRSLPHAVHPEHGLASGWQRQWQRRGGRGRGGWAGYAARAEGCGKSARGAAAVTCSSVCSQRAPRRRMSCGGRCRQTAARCEAQHTGCNSLPRERTKRGTSSQSLASWCCLSEQLAGAAIAGWVHLLRAPICGPTEQRSLAWVAGHVSLSPQDFVFSWSPTHLGCASHYDRLLQPANLPPCTSAGRGRRVSVFAAITTACAYKGPHEAVGTQR